MSLDVWGMVRLAFAIAALAFSLGCARAPDANASDVDFVVGDQCSYTVAQRPADCYGQPPCMWSDADLRVSRGQNGLLQVHAGQGGWETRVEPDRRAVDAEVNSAIALARQFPQILARLHPAPPAVSRSCVRLNPGQNMRFGDVVALHRALAAHVRQVQIVDTTAFP